MKPTCREFLRGSVAIAALPHSIPVELAREAEASDTLWYEQEAKRWLEALPIGNGRLAGMVFGDVKAERIALSESTAWAGAPNTSDGNPTGRENLVDVELRGDFQAASFTLDSGAR